MILKRKCIISKMKGIIILQFGCSKTIYYFKGIMKAFSSLQ
jgi:hypothetical protein